MLAVALNVSQLICFFAIIFMYYFHNFFCIMLFWLFLYKYRTEQFFYLLICLLKIQIFKKVSEISVLHSSFQFLHFVRDYFINSDKSDDDLMIGHSMNMPI